VLLLAELTILKQIAYIVIVVSIVVAIFVIGTKFVLGTANPVYVVSSGSMIPTLNIGDLVIIQHSNNTSFNNLKVGDIIVFKSYGVTRTGQHLTIVHRVAAIRMDIHSNRIIRTKGDANPISIPLVDYPIMEKNYIGKVVYVIPKVGIIPLTSDRTVIHIIIGSIIIIILAYSFRKGRRENNRERIL
jgi:signal peptidase